MVFDKPWETFRSLVELMVEILEEEVEEEEEKEDVVVVLEEEEEICRICRSICSILPPFGLEELCCCDNQI